MKYLIITFFTILASAYALSEEPSIRSNPRTSESVNMEQDKSCPMWAKSYSITGTFRKTFSKTEIAAIENGEINGNYTGKLKPWIAKERLRLLQGITGLDCSGRGGINISQKSRSLSSSIGSYYELPYNEVFFACCIDETLNRTNPSPFFKGDDAPTEPIRTPAQLGISVIKPLRMKSLPVR